MVFEILDGSFCGILEMNIRGGDGKGYFIKEGLLEDIKSFIFHGLGIGLVTKSCEYV